MLMALLHAIAAFFTACLAELSRRVALIGTLGAIVEALIAFFQSCVGELYRRRRRPHATVLLLLAICLFIAWLSVQAAAEAVSTASPTPPHLDASAVLPPPPPVRSLESREQHGTTSRVAVTIRSLHTGKYWQLQKDGDGTGSRLRLSASASPQQRGLESTVFLLEREGDTDGGGWVLLRWLKTRQLLEAVPPGVPGREDDAWSVRLSEAPAVNELHKLMIEDDATHSQSHIWSFGIRGYLNQLEASGDVVGHGDALPPAAASEPPRRGAVAVERLQSGAAWLMEALEQRDKQLDALQEQLTAARAELAALAAQEPMPGRPVSSRGRRPQDEAAAGDPTHANAASTTPSAAASAAGVGGLAEVRTAAQRRPHVHVECPASGGAAPAAARRATSARGRRGRGREAARGDADDVEEDKEAAAANVTHACSTGGVPLWSYMAGGEYLRFVRGIASRLRLGSGDALLDLAAGDCGASSLAIQQLYRGRLKSLALLPNAGAVRLFGQALHARSAPGRGSPLGPFTPQVNTCVAGVADLGWLPPNAFDAAITFGAFSMLRSRARLCSAYRAVLRAVRPGGRFIVADAEHPARCSARSGGHAEAPSSSDDDECGSCHWRASVPIAFWLACTPMDIEVTVSAVEHTDLPGTATHACASHHFALLAQRSSTPHEVRATVEAGSDGGKVALLLSLSAQSVDGQLQRRVQHLKEASIDNKRMYCGLHGYSLVIGEELHHGRDPAWDKVKLMAAQHANYEWLLWVPVDAIFADAASSLGALTDDGRAHLIALQDGSGDGMGTGVLTEPILIRGKTEWSRKLLEQWWGFYADGFGGSDREALQLILTNMHEEERAWRVRIIQPEAVFTSAISAEPLAWQLPYTPPALLVSFDVDAATIAGATERAAGAVACPVQSSDRQMLRCLHAFTSHHLKAIQAADARYHPPAVFDVLASSTAVTTTEDSSSADEASVGGAAAPASSTPSSVPGGTPGGGGEPDSDTGGEVDLAGGWLTPRLSGRPMGGSPQKSFVCPAAPAQSPDVAKGLLKKAVRSRGYPTRLLSAAKELAEHRATAAREASLKEGKSSDSDAHAQQDSKGADDGAEAACAAGSTWARMPRSLLIKHVQAIGTRLGLGEGMSVLDVGATCGHALAILQERYRNKLRAMGIDGSKASMKYARRTCRGTFCFGDVRRLAGIADESFDVAFTMDVMSQFTSEHDVCAVARELGRVVRPGGRAMIVSVPKASCATTQDAEWDCPHCFWRLKSIDKNFWAKCVSLQPVGEGASGAGGAYRVEIVANTALFPTKPSSYCHREHYSVVIHKKSPASVYVFQQPRAKLAVLTVASTPPIGEYGKQKVHYLTELSIENKRQYCAQHGFELVVAQNLAHGRTARWDKVMLLRRMLAQYEWVHWVDLDTLFMNLKRSPMEFLDGAFDLHVAKDANGLNTGSFYVRASPWSHDFLRRVWEHNDGGQGESDQRSFAHVIAQLSGSERSAHVKYYSQKLFNEYPDPIVSFKGWRGHFREGDYLLHFPGTFCGLSPSGVYTDMHLLSCLHRFTIHFVAAM